MAQTQTHETIVPMQTLALGQRLARRLAEVCGIAPWLLYDFRSERRHTVFNQGFNRKGVITEDKTTGKLGFHALAACHAAMKNRT